MLAGSPVCLSDNFTEAGGLALNPFHRDLQVHELQWAIHTQQQAQSSHPAGHPLANKVVAEECRVLMVWHYAGNELYDYLQPSGF